MKILKRTDIEAIGNRIYTAYRKLPQVAEQHMICAVDPDILLPHLLGLDIDYRHISTDRLTFGMTSTEECGVTLFPGDDTCVVYMFDGKTVLIEKDLHTSQNKIGKCNFTKFHEASHHIYKMLYPKYYGYGDDVPHPKLHFSRPTEQKIAPERDWEEWQADTLAACILLPEELIRQGMYLLDLGERIEYLNKLYRHETYEKFCMLAGMMGATPMALAYRMERLGLLEHNQLQDPYSYGDVYFDIPRVENWDAYPKYKSIAAKLQIQSTSNKKRESRETNTGT